MQVRTTRRRSGQTLAHGVFRICETVWVCAAGCTHEVGAPAGGAATRGAVTQRSETLAGLLLPRRTVGSDVMTFVGLQRFVHHRQRVEIRAALHADYGILLSTGEIDPVTSIVPLHEQREVEPRRPASHDADVHSRSLD